MRRPPHPRPLSPEGGEERLIRTYLLTGPPPPLPLGGEGPGERGSDKIGLSTSKRDRTLVGQFDVKTNLTPCGEVNSPLQLQTNPLPAFGEARTEWGVIMAEGTLENEHISSVAPQNQVR